MFEQGQKVIYGSNGVCVIEEIVTREDPMLGEKLTYVIRFSGGMTSYVPVDSPVFMRALLTEEEAGRVIAEYGAIATREFDGSNSKALADQYRAILGRHDPRELFCLYKSLKTRIEQAKQNGKKPGAMSERYSALALDSVLTELCEVLRRDRADVLASLGIDPADAEVSGRFA